MKEITTSTLTIGDIVYNIKDPSHPECIIELVDINSEGEFVYSWYSGCNGWCDEDIWDCGVFLESDINKTFFTDKNVYNSIIEKILKLIIIN